MNAIVDPRDPDYCETCGGECVANYQEVEEEAGREEAESAGLDAAERAGLEEA